MQLWNAQMDSDTQTDPASTHTRVMDCHMRVEKLTLDTRDLSMSIGRRVPFHPFALAPIGRNVLHHVPTGWFSTAPFVDVA